MAKRSQTELSSIVEGAKHFVETDGLEVAWDVSYTKVEQSKSVRLQSVFPAHLRLTGQATGKLYEWLKSGDVVEVDEADELGLLELRVGNSSCCGSTAKGNRLLQKVI